MLLEKKINYYFLLAISLLFINLPLIYSNFFSNENEVSSYDSLNSINFDPLYTECFNIDNIQENIENYIITNEYRDIYLSESLKNINCINKVVDVYIDQEEQKILVFYGRNTKVNYLYASGIIFIFLFSIFTKSNRFFMLITIFYLFNFDFLFGHFFSFRNFLIEVLTLYLFFLLFTRIFFKKYYTILFSSLKSLSSNINLKLPTYKLNLKSFNNFSSISLLSFLACFLSYVEFQSKSKYEIFNDELIQIFTSAKMFYYDQTSMQAAWNQHTPIVGDLFKNIYRVSDYENYFLGLVVLEGLFSLVTSSILYFLLLKIKDRKIVAFFFSSFFLLYLSNNLLLNRQIANLIYLLIFIFLFWYLESKNNLILFFLIFFGVYQVYNLESFIIPIAFIYLALFINVYRSLSEYIRPIIYGFISLIIIYFNIVINGDLDDVMTTNYLFHINNVERSSSLEYLFGAIGMSSNLSFKHIIFIILVLRIIHFFSLKDFKSNFLELLFSLWYIGEFLHLILTGPRGPQYGAVLYLPTLFLVYLYFSKAERLNRTYVSLILAIFLFSNYQNAIATEIALLRDNYKISTSDIIDSEEKKNIKMILQKNKNQNTPQLILTWINPVDWRYVFVASETLPSTRFWLWHFMRYSPNENRYTWDRNWNEQKIIKDWHTDLEKEQPKYAIVDKYMDQYPKFFGEVLDDYFEVVYEDEYTILYEKVKNIEF